ncbi:MAG: hypothetical protein A2Y15_05270 [Clostridiales bacterium GWF2_36_10]|nr:MAG: hypothetical protein A2Y15_05270 [Clostridiales bacterium GWF2_36_10]
MNFSNKIQKGYEVNCGIVEVGKIVFSPELRKFCESNGCGNFNKNHMCPPLVGESNILIKKARQYKYAIVFNKVYPLEDSYDYEGMVNGQKSFKSDYEKIVELAESTFKNTLFLGVGGCEICEVCSAKSNQPCRFPDKSHASLESYCINVSELATMCRLNYINGTNTVTYFGSVFVK